MAVCLRLRDPHVPGAYGHCAFLSLTGIPCPACGGMRAVNDLSRGRVVAALSENAWVTLTVVGLVIWWGMWVRRRAMGQPAPLAARATTTVVVWTVGLVAFGCLRLVPALGWLRP